MGNALMELFLNSGYFGYLIVTLAFINLLASIAILFIRQRYFIVLLGGANVVLLGTGCLGYYLYSLQAQEALLQVNPDDLQEMILATTVAIEAPLRLAVYTLVPLLVLLLLNFVVYRKYPGD